MTVWGWRLLIGLSLSCIVGCSPSLTRQQARSEISQQLSLASQGDSTAAVTAGENLLQMMDRFDEAELVAIEAEQNFTFETFDAALIAFEMALAKDAGNPKALSYLGILTALKSWKGIMWRMPFNDGGDSWIFLQIFSPVFEASLERSMNKFMYLPHGYKLKTYQEVRERFLPEMREDFRTSRLHLEKVLGNIGVDEKFYLPKVMGAREWLRVRTDDLRVLYRLNFFMEFYLRSIFTYELGEFGTQAQSQAEKYPDLSAPEIALLNQKVGLLADREFFGDLKSKGLEIVAGSQLALDRLAKRADAKKGDSRDLFQALTYEYKTRLVPVEGYPKFIENSLLVAPAGFQSRHVVTTPFSGPYHHVKEIPQDGLISNAHWLERERSDEIQDLRIEAMTSRITRIREAFSGAVEVEFTCTHLKLKRVAMMDLPAFLSKPIEDFRQIGPKFNKQGDIVDAKDRTLGGMFPGGLPCF